MQVIQSFAFQPFWYWRVCRSAIFKVANREGFSSMVFDLVVAVGWNIVSVWQKAPKYATGYDEAAEFVLAHSESPTVFFDGYNNG